MNFSKLNMEFSNLQVKFENYEKVLNLINIRIKSNEKEIVKYESKIKNTKVIIEKDIFKILEDCIKKETTFLKELIESEGKENE